MINRYPQVLEKIRLEMKEHTPSLFAAASIPSIDELKNLVYLDAAIRENLRLNSQRRHRDEPRPWTPH
jgi:hypothetical protein